VSDTVQQPFLVHGITTSWGGSFTPMVVS